MDRQESTRPDEQPQNEERFLSDTQKVVQRHLADEDDVISEEDIRNVRVGMTPPLDETARDVPDADEHVADHKADSEEDTTPGAQKVTPWDVIEPDA